MTSTYGVTFPIMGKGDVIGENAQDLFKYLKDKTGEEITWNFAKYLVSEDGSTLKYFPPETEPKDLVSDIEAMIS